MSNQGMNLDFSPDELRFQQEVRQFLADSLPPHIVAATANNATVIVQKDIALRNVAFPVFRQYFPQGIPGTDIGPTRR